jgi:hypothetical protein
MPEFTDDLRGLSDDSHAPTAAYITPQITRVGTLDELTLGMQPGDSDFGADGAGISGSF